MSSASSKPVESTRYTRGPYKKREGNLYRTKIIGQENNTDCQEIFDYLSKIKNDFKKRFKISYNRSKVIENIQGLMDCLSKQIRYKNENELLIEKVSKLQDKVKDLERRLEQKEAHDDVISDSWIESILQQELPDVD